MALSLIGCVGDQDKRGPNTGGKRGGGWEHMEEGLGWWEGE